MVIDQLLICTDLDRTLIPNGQQSESSNARKLFSKLVSNSQVTLAYVSGRDRDLVQQAIEEYQLPVPNFVVADVGSTIYKVEENQWLRVQDWDRKIALDWQNNTQSDLVYLFSDLKQCRLQEKQKQGLHKLSYYFDLNVEVEKIMAQMRSRLEDKKFKSNLIWSIDEQANVGLLDILPFSANKRYAIEFMMENQNFNLENTVFSGDSGNDLDVLVSPIKAILVANAHSELKEKVLLESQKQGFVDSIYIAKGLSPDTNGNYSAGIIEGINHYFPNSKLLAFNLT